MPFIRVMYFFWVNGLGLDIANTCNKNNESNKKKVLLQRINFKKGFVII